MSKGMTFVVAYSIFTIVLFCVIVYLMTTVNPAPIVPSDSQTGEVDDDTREILPLPADKHKTAKSNFETFLKNLQVPDKAQYGLAKAEPVEMYNSTIPLYAFNVSLSRDGNQKYVEPPVWPRDGTTTMNTPTLNEPFATNLTTLESTRLPLKGLRRSVDGINEIHKMDTMAGGLILKLVDDDGQSRIEIKLGSGGSYDKRKLRKYRSPKSNLTLKESEAEEDQVIKKTVIRIMPNDTVFVDEPEKIFNDFDDTFVADILQVNKTNESYVDKDSVTIIKNDTKLEMQTDYEHVFNAFNITDNTTSDENLNEIKLFFSNQTEPDDHNSVEETTDIESIMDSKLSKNKGNLRLVY